MTDDNWAAGDAYEGYMGRWSRPLARSFVGWLAAPTGAAWIDVGCGTGALAAAICDLARPSSVLACDPSESFVNHARRNLPDPRVTFAVATAEDLPKTVRSVDFVVSGLVLNFLSNPGSAVSRLRELLVPHGVLAASVWDYEKGFEFLRAFWDEAVIGDPGARALDEGQRFSGFRPEGLKALFQAAGLREVTGDSLVITTRFRDFDDFWAPFTRGTGPAPSYVASLPGVKREELRGRLSRRLEPEADGSILLTAKAWAVRGRRPAQA